MASRCGLRLLIAFLGKGNTSGLSLHKLEADKFAASRLYGKLANICPDLPSEHLAGTSMFKADHGRRYGHGRVQVQGLVRLHPVCPAGLLREPCATITGFVPRILRPMGGHSV